MKHLKLTFLLTVLMSMVGAKSFAHDIEVANADGKTIYYNWTNNNTELSVSYRGISATSYENEYTENVVIPEYVTLFTSAVFNKKNYKIYRTNETSFEYRSVPNDVFYEGITFLKNEEGIRYKIATKEKALCDALYSKYPVRTICEFKTLLFEDLRIDEEEFTKLNFDFIIRIAPQYHSNTLLTLGKFLQTKR